ncbi:hypothetical protein [Streptomyces sp. NPDC126503]|uniref:hypothetical protein n=1 Tax=Streptomyces sp. NPDC126503 TaxID=3155315 RepID=UPI00331AB0F7
MPRFNQTHPESVPVPLTPRIVELVVDSLPESVRQAVMDAEDAVREIRRYRPLASDEDRADREFELARLAAANKQLAAHHPNLIVTGWERAA